VTWLLLALCGGAGAVARYLVDQAIQRRTGGTFPLGILVVNVTGSFLLGILVGLATGGITARLLGVGFLGSYTTFSTWMLDTRRLARDDAPERGSANIVVSQAGGVTAAALGWWLGSLV
jgi:fluoride exporter